MKFPIPSEQLEEGRTDVWPALGRLNRRREDEDEPCEDVIHCEASARGTRHRMIRGQRAVD
jgi:hypothetical protein